MMRKVLVLGSTGNIGWPLVQLLAQDPSVAVVAGVHTTVPSEMAALPVTPVRFDFTDPTTFAAALAGVEQVFFVRPPQLADPEHDMRPFLEAVKHHHVRQTVFVSLMGVEKNPMVPHRKIERLISTLGLPHTFIRPSFFMQNLSTTHCADIRDHHDLFIPAGRSKTSFIDTADIAAVAAVVLREARYLNTALTLTGPAALTYTEVARIMTTTLGVPITYSRPSLRTFRRTMLRRGEPKDFVNVEVMLYLITQLGNAKQTTSTVADVLGRPAHDLAQFVAAHRQAFLA